MLKAIRDTLRWIKRVDTYNRLVTVFKKNWATRSGNRYKWNGVSLNPYVAMYIERNGRHYPFEVYIESRDGFTCVDIAVLIWDIEDHDWCWNQLNKLGITKKDLGLKDKEKKH